VSVAEAKRAWFKTIGYEPHTPQWLFHNSSARFRVPCCGRRFGKSTMAARDLEPNLMTHGKRYWVVGPTYDLGEKEFRVVWDDLIVRQKLGRDKRVKKGYNKKQGSMYIEFPWQTLIEVRSADHPENLVGEALDGVIMSEAAKQKLETWQRFIFPALSDKRGWATFPTTPEGFNWLHGVWQTGQDPNEPLFESWTFPSWANSKVYPGGREDPEIKLLERNSEPAWFMQEIGAEFAAFVGKVYGEFREAIHVQDVKYDPGLPNYVTIDWGWANPMAAVEFQVAPDDTVRVWRMHYRKNQTVGEFFEQMVRDSDGIAGYRITQAFGDHARPDAAVEVTKIFADAAQGKGAFQGDPPRKGFEGAVCETSPDAKKDWNQGVETVKKFLKVEDDIDVDESGDGEYVVSYRTHFVIDRSCKEGIKEFHNYKNKPGTNGLNAPEQGMKQQDHFLDALRYGLMHVFVLGVASHLGELYTETIQQPGLIVPTEFANKLWYPDVPELWTPSAGGVFQMRGAGYDDFEDYRGYDEFTSSGFGQRF
jgi:hypothetical protein